MGDLCKFSPGDVEVSQGGGPGAALGHGDISVPADVQVGQFGKLPYQPAHRGQRLDSRGTEAGMSSGSRSYLLQTGVSFLKVFLDLYLNRLYADFT